MRWFTLIFVVTNVLCEEPQCSKFHYEVQTLDKMIRTEIKVEAIEKEILKTNQLVLESIQTLNSERETAKTDREDFSKDYSDLKKSILDELNVLKGDLNQDYTDLKNKLLEEVKEIRDTLLTPSIAFKARSPADLSPETGQTVVFNTVMMNEGGAYDNTTGIFSVPVAGTYLFTIHICMQTGIYFNYGLVYDNIVFTSGAYGDYNYLKCYTADAILVLKPGQKVWLKCLAGSTTNQLYEYTSGSNNYWNTFAGVLIHK